MPRRFARLAWIAAASWALATVSFSQDSYQFSDPNVADVTGPNGFRARLVVDGITRMPSKLIYPNDAQEETMTFEDRPDASGLKLPFHMTTTAGGRIVDELILEQILVNPEISKSDFKR
jgi:hypothetical protein